MHSACEPYKVHIYILKICLPLMVRQLTETFNGVNKQVFLYIY